MATSILIEGDPSKSRILSDAGNEVLQSLPRNFSYVVVQEDLDEDDEGSEQKGQGQLQQRCLTIRSSLSKINQVEKWIVAFQQNTLTRWIVARGTQDPTRFLFRRQWSCQHSSLNKGRSKAKSKSTDCKAKLDIKIKKQTCDTRKKDAYLKLRPPHPAIIKVYYKHNHGTEFVQRRENFLVEFARNQRELKTELIRLNQLLTKSKPANSAIKQLANALKQIRTEADLFEAMRKVRLKTNNFASRVGRPKRKPDEGPEVKSSTKMCKKEETGSGDADAESEVIYSILPIEQDPEQFSDITITTEQEEQALDISFLLTNSPSPLSNSTPFT